MYFFAFIGDGVGAICMMLGHYVIFDILKGILSATVQTVELENCPFGK